MTREDLEICFELKLKILLNEEVPKYIIYSNCGPNSYKMALEDRIQHQFFTNSYCSPFTKLINCKISKALYPQALEYKNYLLIPKYEKEFAKWKD